jgi:hypothetical protein
VLAHVVRDVEIPALDLDPHSSTSRLKR